MRSALIGFVIAVPLAATAQSGGAQESFFNERFCASADADAFPDCSFRTWEQCIASARGEVVHHECVVVRTSTAAENARQETSAQSLEGLSGRERKGIAR